VASPRAVAAKRAPAPAPAKKRTGFFSRHGNVYIYVPNLIGACLAHACVARESGARVRAGACWNAAWAAPTLTEGGER
jgi:hypothetical protein